MKNNDSDILIKKLYKFISDSLDKNDKKFQANIAKFINTHHDKIFDIAPYDIIYFNQTDVDNMYNSLDITEEQVINIIKECFFWEIPYNPQCAKEPYVLVLIMAIRYYLKNNKTKHAEITSIYLAFSGKFYASIYGGIAFKYAPPSKNKAAMDYVINNVLSDKFDLKKEGTVFGAVKSLCITWLDTYRSILVSNDSSDDDFGKVIQQLRDRERSFLMNIAKPFYDACANKNYLNYETDNLDEKEFRITDNDAALASRITENTINYMTSNYVSLEICNKCKDVNVKATEVKDIMESILGDNNNLSKIRRVLNIIICDFMRNYPGVKVKSIEFVSYTMKSKPNTKDPLLHELKETILTWLDENSPAYRKRKSRKATQISYYKSILLYFTLIINKVAN